MMSPEEFEQKLQGLLAAEPFQPFAVEFDDGERFLVENRAMLWYHGGGTAVFFHRDGNIDFIDCRAIHRFLTVTLTAIPF